MAILVVTTTILTKASPSMSWKETKNKAIICAHQMDAVFIDVFNILF